jgi:hypothetical protein
MSSYKTLLIPILNEILVKEIGEANIPSLEWTRVSPTKYKFWVDINDYTEIVTVEFEHIEDDISKQFYFPPKYKNLDNVFNVGYVVSGAEIQFAKTDLKTLLTILSTVVDIIKNFIENHPSLNGLYIKGTEKELGSGDISKKTNLYKAFIQKQTQTIPGFGSDYYREGFILVKK